MRTTTQHPIRINGYDFRARSTRRGFPIAGRHDHVIGYENEAAYDAFRSALALGLLILRAQRREDPSPSDGSEHPVTCRRRCCA